MDEPGADTRSILNGNENGTSNEINVEINAL